MSIGVWLALRITILSLTETAVLPINNEFSAGKISLKQQSAFHYEYFGEDYTKAKMTEIF